MQTLTILDFGSGEVHQYHNINYEKYEYGWNSRDLITAFLGVSDKEFTKDYVKNKVGEVYSTFKNEEIDELFNKINNVND